MGSDEVRSSLIEGVHVRRYNANNLAKTLEKCYSSRASILRPPVRELGALIIPHLNEMFWLLKTPMLMSTYAAQLVT